MFFLYETGTKHLKYNVVFLLSTTKRVSHMNEVNTSYDSVHLIYINIWIQSYNVFEFFLQCTTLFSYEDTVSCQQQNLNFSLFYYPLVLSTKLRLKILTSIQTIYVLPSVCNSDAYCLFPTLLLPSRLHSLLMGRWRE